MPEFDYESQLSAARAAAVGLKQRLEARVLDKVLPELHTGAVSFGEARAVEVGFSRGRNYECQITLSDLWDVKMREFGKKYDGDGYSYSVGLDKFLAKVEINALFETAFQGIDARALEIESYNRIN